MGGRESIRPELRGLAEHEPPDLRRPRRVQAQPREALERQRERRVRLQAREVHPDAHVRPAREREVAPRVRASRVEAVGIGERRRIPVGGSDRDPHEVARRDPRSAELGVRGRVAVDRRRGGLEAQRLLHDRLQRRPAVAVPEQVDERVGDHPLGRLDPAEQHHGGVGDVLVLGEPAVEPVPARPQRVGQRRHRLGRLGARGAAGAEVADGPDDRVVVAEHGADVRVREPERAGHDRRRQRAGEAAPQLALPGGRERVQQQGGLLAHRAGQRLAHGAEPQRRDEGRPVAVVLGPVEREHARPDDPRGREPRVLDRERLRVAHRGEREVAARDEPAVDRRQPRDRLALAQAGQQRVRRALELLDRRRGADREASRPHRGQHGRRPHMYLPARGEGIWIRGEQP